MTIHCHQCKVVFDIARGSADEKMFISTNLLDSTPDLTKIFFCTFDCYVDNLMDTEFRPQKIIEIIRGRKHFRHPTEEEVEEQKKDYRQTRCIESAKNPGIIAWAKQNELVDKIVPVDCVLYEEETQKDKNAKKTDFDNDLTCWADCWDT